MCVWLTLLPVIQKEKKNGNVEEDDVDCNDSYDNKCIDDNDESASNDEEFDYNTRCDNDNDKNKKESSSSTSTYILRKKPRIIRYVKYNQQKEEYNYCCEHLMLFYPWINENEEV